MLVSTNSLSFMQVVSRPTDLSVCTQAVPSLQIGQHPALRLGVSTLLIRDLPQSSGQHGGYRRISFGGGDLELPEQIIRKRQRHISCFHILKCSTCLRGETLDGRFATYARIAGAVHFTHAAGAEGREDLVGAEPSAGGETHFPNPATRRRTSSKKFSARIT
jgi:hypothetical protein